MPQYKKVFDIGTYTGNGGQYRVGIPTLRGVGPTGTQVGGSTRFRSGGSTSLSRTPGTTGNRKTWTWSGWVKRGVVGTAQNWYTLFSAGSYTGSSAHCAFYTSGAKVDIISFYQYTGGYQLFYETVVSYKDTSCWNHVVVAVDTTQATAANRVLIYVNGAQVTSFQTSTASTQNLDTYLNLSGTAGYIGSTDRTSTDNLNGYLSEVNFIDGQRLTPSSFGEFNSDGIWVPKAYSGTYGTNGFYLPMNSSANYATDQSGNGNNWTPVGFNTTTANTTYDLFTDSPTDYLSGSMTTANNAGNYCTWSYKNSYIPSGSPGSAQFINGNMEASIASSVLGWVDLRGTFVIPQQGKWYWEIYQYNNSAYINGVYIGVCDQKKAASNLPPYSAGDYGYLFDINNGNKIMNGSSSAYGSTPGNSTTICIAFDADNNKIWFGTNGTWVASGNPAAGTNEAGSTLSGLNYVPCCSIIAGNAEQYRHYAISNFGQRPFGYTVPSGFKALNTYNITRPADSSLWFYGDTPDLMWIKNRSTTGLHTWTDTVRGMGLNLVSSSTAAETSYPGVTEMNKFGMSIINDATSILNGNGNSHVYWAWKAGGTTSVTNTDGTITSQVSANRQAGFSVVTYTGSGSGSSTVGHGLGVAPSMIIIKNRSLSQSWPVMHTSLPTNGNVFLDLTQAHQTTYVQGGIANPANTTTFGFVTGSSGGNQVYASGSNYVAYCFAPVAGYSAFGSYTGNGSADGPFVYTGFRPRWLMIKSSTYASTGWRIFDTTRSTYNPIIERLWAHANNAELTTSSIDFYSNGFKIRDASLSDWYDYNKSGDTYIYAAFAEIPFKFARAR